MDIFTVLALVGGLALFLYGMDLMGDSLKKLAGGKLESTLAKLTSTRIKGFLLGFIVTAIIQSSSATTVMLVGFVNSGIMKLGQTISIIMGANIGTTVTAWLLSTADIQGTAILIKLFKPESFTPILALIGFIMMIAAKDDKKKNTGSILMGFAVLMFGMQAMSGAMSGLKDNEAFTQMLTVFSNPVVGILFGTIFTAIIQSSSASVGVLQALALTCNIPFSTAIPVILGQNIGTTITPIISSINANTESKRVAMSCLYIKLIGVVIVAGAFYAVNGFVGLEFMNNRAGAMDIAVVHTLFNILSTVILLPFCSLIEKLALKTIPDKKQENNEQDVFATLDERFLNIPAFAVEKCKELVCDMSKISSDAFKTAISLFDNYSSDVFEKVNQMEKLVDKYEDKTSTYLVKIAETQISTKDSKIVSALLHCVGDIERISDHALNIAESAKEIYEKQITFSDKAKEDIKTMASAVEEILELSINTLVDEDLETAKHVEPLEQVIDNLKRKIKSGHISRLRQGDCTMELGFVLSDMLNDFERISDHCSNIAVCFIEIANDSFEVHEYLNQLKDSDESDFDNMYESYKQKYALK